MYKKTQRCSLKDALPNQPKMLLKNDPPTPMLKTQEDVTPLLMHQASNPKGPNKNRMPLSSYHAMQCEKQESRRIMNPSVEAMKVVKNRQRERQRSRQNPECFHLFSKISSFKHPGIDVHHKNLAQASSSLESGNAKLTSASFC